MATKQQNQPLDSTGCAALAEQPPRISLASPLLASAIDLPSQPLIVYSVYTPVSGQPGLDPLYALEQARRRIVEKNSSLAVVDSLLPSVHLSRDSSVLYIFAFSSIHKPSDSQTALQGAQFDDLICESILLFVIGFTETDHPTASMSILSVNCSCHLPCVQVIYITHLFPFSRSGFPKNHYAFANLVSLL